MNSRKYGAKKTGGRHSGDRKSWADRKSGNQGPSHARGAQRGHDTRSQPHSQQGSTNHSAHSANRSNFVIGPHALEALVAASPGRIVEVLSAADGSSAVAAAQQLGISVTQTSRDKITEIAGTESHQGVLCFVKPRGFETLEQLMSRLEQDPNRRSVVVMLDSINDPHNLGACLRACECFGVDAAIFSKNRGSPITPVVSKTSVGASELVSIVQVSNLAQAQLKLGEIGFESVATAIDPRAQSLSNFSFPHRTLLILGAEGPGVQPLLLKKSEHVVYVPMFGKIDSLNVSQALAVTLSWSRR